MLTIPGNHGSKIWFKAVVFKNFIKTIVENKIIDLRFVGKTLDLGYYLTLVK